MRRFEFVLALSSEKTHRLYAGEARYLLVEDRDGLRLQLPLGNFRRFVDASGIHGCFEVEIDGDNRITRLRRIQGNPG